MKKKGFNRVFICPNCKGVYEMVPIMEISDVCKRCKHRKPQTAYCKRGFNQYVKRAVCSWREYHTARYKRKVERTKKWRKKGV